MVMRSALVLALLLAASGCKSSRGDVPPTTTSSTPAPQPTCRQGVGDDVRLAGRTAGAAAKTGATTAVDGVKQAGRSAAGLVHGGTSEAGEKWHEGGEQTKATANEGAAETRKEASVPPCKNP